MMRYLRSTVLPSKPAQLLIQTGLKWNQDNGSGMSAALSYYALFSLFPILLVVLSVVGSLVGPNTEAFQTIQSAARQFLPPEVHDLIRSTVLALNDNSVGAGIIGFCLLLFTASTVFAILKSSVNRIWRSPNDSTEASSFLKVVRHSIVDKLLAFVLVLGTALLLLVSLVSNIVIKTILSLVTNFQELFSWIEINELQLDRGLQASSSILILAIACCILFKILPGVEVSWGDVWLGALITAVLLVGLQQLVSNSVISIGGQFLSYGVIGSVMILMLWIFLTCQIFLLGCVFSYVYAHLWGSRRAESLHE